MLSSGLGIWVKHIIFCLQIIKHPQGLLVTQQKFMLDLLSKFNCLYISPVSSPFNVHSKLSVDSGELLPKPSTYRTLIGKLNFLQHSRPDISFSVQHLSQFMSQPGVPHFFCCTACVEILSGHLSFGFAF